MDEAIKAHMTNIHSDDRHLQGKAFSSLMEATGRPVDWAYEVWDDLLRDSGAQGQPFAGDRRPSPLQSGQE